MRVLVVGAGAVGGYFGARLAAAGRDVTFLVRERRAEQLRRNGLQVTSPRDHFAIQPKLLLASDLRVSAETFDLILLSVKAYSLDAAMEDFAPAVGATTLILPLLNGMRHLDTLDERFGKEHVLGGSTRISADLDAEGNVHSFEDLQDLVYGARGSGCVAAIDEVTATLHDAGFDDKRSDDIVAFMWQKWMILSSLAAITCLLRGSIGAVAAAPGGVQIERMILAESMAVASANGYPPTDDFREMLTARLTAPGSALTASMYRDLTKGSAVEADQILGDLLRRGEAHGVAAPLLRAAYVQLCVYQAAMQKA